MVLLFGKRKVNKNWIVEENEASVFMRMYFIFGGECFYKDDEQEIKLKKNYIYFFPSNKAYKLWQNTENRLECLFLHMTIAPDTMDRLIEIDIEEDNFLKGIITSLSDLSEKNDAELISSLAESLNIYLHKKAFSKTTSPLVFHATKIIINTVSENLTVEKLSEQCGYTSEYFIRVFKKQMGISPYKYILNYKMKLAQRSFYLGNSVGETAFNLGYNETRSFSRAFKNYFKQTPQEYIAEIKKDIEQSP